MPLTIITMTVPVTKNLFEKSVRRVPVDTGMSENNEGRGDVRHKSTLTKPELFAAKTMQLQQNKTFRTGSKIPIIRKAVTAGLLGSLGLFGFYFGVLASVTGDITHPWQQFILFQPWMTALIIGFGIQIFLWRLLSSGLRLRPQMMTSTKTGVVAGGSATVSSISMAACCAHHLADFVPILGISGAALFLTEYQRELLLLGVGFNLLGIGFMVWHLFGKENPQVIWAYLLARGRTK